MKSEIIITLKDESGNFGYDLEVPTDIHVGTLIGNIKETLNSYNSQLIQTRRFNDLYSIRLNETLNHKRSLGNIGIWNGDILIMK